MKLKLDHLRPETRRWVQETLREYELEPHHLRLLLKSAEAWDRSEQAKELLAEHGLIFVDRFGQPRARPEVGIERDARLSFARLTRELGFDSGSPDARPPRIGGGC